MNGRSLIQSLVLLVFFLILIMVTPVQAMNTTLTPTSATAGSTSNAYIAKLDPTGGPAGGFYLINITIPAGYTFNIPGASRTVGNYTMFDKAQNKNKVLINITSASSDPDGYLVNVTFSTDYGATSSYSNYQNISSMSIGASTLKITRPTASIPGYFNISLGGTAGPINTTNNNVTLVLAGGTLINPDTAGSYNWKCEAKNPVGTAYTSYNTVQITATTAPFTSSGNDGGTGGQGVTSAEPFDNINNYETRFEFLRAGIPVSFKFTTAELWIYEIALTGKENENDIAVRVESLKGMSKLVTGPAPGTKYLNIWVGSHRIQEGLINFKVPNSWITAEGIMRSEDVRMYRWDGSNWLMLETSQISRDDANTYYQARTDAFSYFAISGLKGTPAPAVTATPTGTATPVVTAKPVTGGAARSVNLFFIIAVFLVVVAGAGLYLKSRKKK